MSENAGTEPGPTDERRVLAVRVASPDEAFDRLEPTFAALDAGERPDPTFEVVLQHEEDLQRLLRATNLELLRTIAREHPGSIRETARLVERDVRQVHDNLRELEQLNLVRLESEGAARRPVVWYDEIDVELPIADERGRPTAA